EDVAVPDRRARQRDVLLCESALQPEIGLGSGNDAVAFELVLRFQEARDGQEHAIAIYDFSRLADKERAVSISIKGHAQLRFFLNNALLQTLQMERTAARVDIAAVGRNAHRYNVAAERAKQFRPQLVGCAVGAIQNDAKAAQFGSRNHFFSQKFQILRV